MPKPDGLSTILVRVWLTVIQLCVPWQPLRWPTRCNFTVRALNMPWSIMPKTIQFGSSAWSRTYKVMVQKVLRDLGKLVVGPVVAQRDNTSSIALMNHKL